MYNYCSCRTRKNHRSCDKKPVPKYAIETLVYNDVLRLFAPERIDKIADGCNAFNRKYIESTSVAPLIQRELEAVNEK